MYYIHIHVYIYDICVYRSVITSSNPVSMFIQHNHRLDSSVRITTPYRQQSQHTIYIHIQYMYIHMYMYMYMYIHSKYSYITQ